MNLLALPVVLAFSFVTALLFGLAAQRLLGIRLGLVRLFIAGVFAMLINWPIQSALLGDLADGEPTGHDAVPRCSSASSRPHARFWPRWSSWC